MWSLPLHGTQQLQRCHICNCVHIPAVRLLPVLTQAREAATTVDDAVLPTVLHHHSELPYGPTQLQLAILNPRN